jgi:SAM-dependent methyltransferase
MSAPPGTKPGPVRPWETCLDVEAQDGAHYHDYVNEALLGAVTERPERALDLGCAGGSFGARLKEKFPGVHVTGIELGRAAAARAATRIDRVIASRIEEVDFGSADLGPGRFDLVVAGDVLEHLVNPWALLGRVRPCIAPNGRLVASIPNVRNLQLIADLLLNGRWSYDERGLLDVTHLRFFAFEDIRALFEETGYLIESFSANLSPRLRPLYHQHAGKGPVSLRVDRLQVDGISRRELTELCTEQFVLTARPA